MNRGKIKMDGALSGKSKLMAGLAKSRGGLILLGAVMIVTSASHAAAADGAAPAIRYMGALSTKQEYMACRSAIFRSCFAPSQCEQSYQTSPCVRVTCGTSTIGKDQDGNEITIDLGGYDGGGPASWGIGKILSAGDYAGFRSDTWEDAMRNRSRINICREHYESLGFIGKYGNAAEKAALRAAKPDTASSGSDGLPSQLITADDLGACKKEIAEFHRLEINYLKNQAQKHCTKGTELYSARRCSRANERVSETSTKSNLAWYMEGNTSDDDNNYPNFGLSIFNGEQPVEELIRSVAKNPHTASFEGDKWGNYSSVVEKCVANIWLAKRDGKNSVNASGKPSGKTAAGNSSPAEVVGTQLINQPSSNQSQPSASEPRPIGHIVTNCPGNMKGLSMFASSKNCNDKESLREKRERELAHKKNVKQHEKDVRKRQAEQMALQKKRDAEAARQQQAITNRRVAQEAAVAKEVAKQRAAIQAEVNREDAVTSAIEATCPPYVVFNNHTNVQLWVTWEYTMLVGDNPVPWSTSTGLPPKGRARQIIIPHECETKPWKVLPGSVLRWE